MATCAMMFSSEQVLETHLVAYVPGIFCCPKAYLFGARCAVYRSCCNGNARVATWVSSHDRRRTLRVQEA